jgi:Uma2 family endonuclease
MVEPAIRQMTLAEFLCWDDGTDARHELIDGIPVAMAPAARPHGALSGNVAGAIHAALQSRPECTVYIEAGIVPSNRADNFYVPDLSVSCDEPDDDQPQLRNPVLIVEILSPSTAAFDRTRKMSDYRLIPSVQEILLLDSRRMFAEIWRRAGDGWVHEVIDDPGATVTLNCIPLSILMGTLYRGVRIPDRRGRQGDDERGTRR